MGKIFKGIAKILGPVLLFFGGPLAILGGALIIGSTAMDAVQARKQKKAFQKGLEAAAASQTVMIRQAIVSRRIVYGRTRIGGVWVYVDNSSTNEYLYLVLSLCDGPIKAIPEIYFDDQIVTLSGSVGTGKWDGKVRVNKHTGEVDQAVDSDLETDSTEWTNNHKLLGIAYTSLRLKFDPNVFPNGLPNVSAVIEGRDDIVDSRGNPTGYTTNPALCLAHYLSMTNFGPNVDWSNEIDQNALSAAANICDEFVDLEATGNFNVTSGSDANQIDSTAHGLFNSQVVVFTTTGTLPAGLSLATDYFVVNALVDSFEVSATLDGSPVTMTNNGTGTHSFTAKERRYTFNGMVDLDQSPEDIIRLFRDAMSGTVAYIGGKWTMTAGAYQSPTFTIDETMLIGPIKMRPRRSKRERFNTVKGFFLAHHNRFQASDYPVLINSTYVTNDGEELIQGMDLPSTNTPTMANRIAKILLEKSRLERTLELECNIEALQAQAGKTIKVNLPRYNITNEPYDVDSFNLDTSNGKVAVQLSLSQTSSNVYTWASGSDEQAVVITPEPELSDGTPEAPTGLAPTNNANGRDLVEVFLEWDATDDEFILQGGLVVVEWKKTSTPDTENAWQSITGSPQSIEYPVVGLVPDINYDFRVAWRNKFGGKSDWATINAHQTASSLSSAYNYKHTQGVASTEWVIQHNLGYRPSVGAVFDHEGNQQNGDEAEGTASDPTGESEIKLTFDSAIYGTAYLS